MYNVWENIGCALCAETGLCYIVIVGYKPACLPSNGGMFRSCQLFCWFKLSTLCSEKTPTHIFFHISMNYLWIQTKIAVNIPKDWHILTM